MSCTRTKQGAAQCREYWEYKVQGNLTGHRPRSLTSRSGRATRVAAGTWTLNGGGRISLRCQWHCRNWSLTDTVHDVEPRIDVVIRLALLKGPDGVRRRCVVCAIGSVREILSMTDCIKTCRHSRYDHLWKSKGSALVTWVGARKTVYRCARTASDLRPKLGRKP